MKKIGRIILKSLGWFVMGLILFVLIVIGGLNVSKRFIYFEYYSTRENVCKIPSTMCHLTNIKLIPAVSTLLLRAHK